MSERRFLLFLFVFLLALNVSVRLPGLTTPLIDAHSFRQSDTYAMSVLLAEGKSSIWKPRFYQAPVIDNTNHYYLAEFPFYQALLSGLFHWLGESIVLAKLFNVFLFSLSALAIFLIGQKILSRPEGLVAAVVFSFLPSALFWARAVLPDIFGLTMFLLAVASFLNLERPAGRWLASFFLAAAVLTKPFYLAYGLVFLAVNYAKAGVFLPSFVRSCQLLVIPTLFFICWRLWLQSFPLAARLDPSFTALMHQDMGYWAFWQSSRWPLEFGAKFFFELFSPLGGVLVLIGVTSIWVQQSNPKQQLAKYLLSSWVITAMIITLIVSAGTRVHQYYALHWLGGGALLITSSLRSLTQAYRSARITIFPALVLVPLLLYWGYFLPTQQYLHKQSVITAYWSRGMEQEYQQLRKHIPTEAKVVVFLAHYTPQPLNELRRFGFIIDYAQLCQQTTELPQLIQPYLDRQVRYGVVYLGQQMSRKCPASQLQALYSYAEQRLIFRGQDFLLFELPSQK